MGWDGITRHMHWGWLAVKQLRRMRPGHPDRQVQHESATCFYGIRNHLHTCITQQRKGWVNNFFLSSRHLWDHIWRAVSSLGVPSTRDIWTCWSMSRRCLGAGAQDVGEEKKLACSALNSKGKRRLNCCLQLPMDVIAEGMGTDLAVYSDRARGHAAAQVNPRG